MTYVLPCAGDRQLCAALMQLYLLCSVSSGVWILDAFVSLQDFYGFMKSIRLKLEYVFFF